VVQFVFTVSGPTSNDVHQTPSPVPSHRKTEYFNEEIHSRTNVSIHRPLTPADLINSANIFNVFYFALLVLASTFLCIATEGEISLIYLLPLVAFVALVSFHYLKLWWGYDYSAEKGWETFRVKKLIFRRKLISSLQPIFFVFWSSNIFRVACCSSIRRGSFTIGERCYYVIASIDLMWRYGINCF